MSEEARPGLRGEIAAIFDGSGHAVRAVGAGSRILLIGALRALGVGIARLWRATTPKHEQQQPQADRRSAASDFLEHLVFAVVSVAAIAAVTAVVGYFSWHVAAPYAPLATSLAAVVWIIAACCAAPPLPPRDPRNDHGKAGEQHDPAEVGRAIVLHVISAVSEAHAAGLKGCHVSELLKQLRADGLALPAHWTVTELRTWIEGTAQIPVRRSLKIRGAVTYGVHVDDLTDALGMPLPEALIHFESAPAGTSDSGPSDHSPVGAEPASAITLPGPRSEPGSGPDSEALVDTVPRPSPEPAP